MKTQMNSRMSAIYTELDLNKLVDSIGLNQQLLQLLQPGFIEINGAVLLKTLEKLGRNAKLESFPDITGYECFVNHIHIEDYLDDSGVSSNELLKKGHKFAQALLEKLSTTFPNKPFKVIMAHNDSDCSVRFHMVRDGENWLSDDLEGYDQEAILIIETSSQ
jgi:hypothetical protein